MNDRVVLRVDAARDVLYAKREGARIRRSAEAPTDSYLILNRDADGNIVGVQLLSANEMQPIFWSTHPDRNVLPLDILVALDGWMASRH